MPRGLCRECFREIVHGVVCFRCANLVRHGTVRQGGMIRLRTLLPCGQIHTLMASPTVQQILDWRSRHASRRKSRQWIDSPDAPATSRRNR
jgi:hypothetical protein